MTPAREEALEGGGREAEKVAEAWNSAAAEAWPSVHSAKDAGTNRPVAEVATQLA